MWSSADSQSSGPNDKIRGLADGLKMGFNYLIVIV